MRTHDPPQKLVPIHPLLFQNFTEWLAEAKRLIDARLVNQETVTLDQRLAWAVAHAWEQEVVTAVPWLREVDKKAA